MLLKDIWKEGENQERKSMIANLAAKLILSQGKKSSKLIPELFANQFKSSYPTQYKIRFIQKLLQDKGTRSSPVKGVNAWDKIIQQGGFKSAMERASKDNITPWRALRRLLNKNLWKYAFSTLSWDYIKQQLQFALNQRKLVNSSLWNTEAMENHPTNPRKMEEAAIKRLIMNPNKKPSDSSPLSSSVVIWGKWTPQMGSGQYWIGLLELVYAPLKKCNVDGGRYPAKTYIHNNISLATWALMKGAMGMCGTGAYTVFKNTRNSGIGMIPAFGWSEQVTRPIRLE